MEYSHQKSLLARFAMIGLAVLAIHGAAVAIWRMRLPLEIDPNEPWNAWWADALFSAHGLYAKPDELIANNYPPLSFVINHSLATLTGTSALDVGRCLSLFSVLVTCCAAYAILHKRFRVNTGSSALGAVWFLALMFTYFNRYAGMNDPQLLALAVMALGLLVVLKPDPGAKFVLAGVVIMVLAGFIKHSLWATPVSLFMFLAITDRRNAMFFATAGMLSAGIGLGLCAMIWGSDFLSALTTPRQTDLSAAFQHIHGLAWFGAATALLIWAGRGKSHDKGFRFTAIFLGVALCVDLFQRAGAGVDINAEMELALASAFAIGVGSERLLSNASIAKWKKACAALLVLVPVAAAFPLQSANVYSTTWRQQAAQRAAAFDREVERVRSMNGALLCSVASLCYRAGKANVFDYFITNQRVKTGVWKQAELDSKIAAAGLQGVTVDSGAAW